MTAQAHPAASHPPRWPDRPDLLVDTTRCPSCFTPLQRAICDACGLRLDVPAAAEVLAAGVRVLDAERDRQGVLRRMRAEQSRAERETLFTAPAPSIPVSVAAVATEPPAAPAAPPTSPPPVEPTAPDAATDARPRRSGVQVLLLTLGVVLLSVAAVVFLLVAYLVASLEVRSVITAAASVLVLGLAWLLRARGLGGTAEGVASVAVVLLVLDAWIVRANGLFGTDRLDEVGYWGGALLVVAAVLAGARRVSGVRAPGLAAAALAPAGAFLLGFGAAPDDELWTAGWLGGLAALVVGTALQFGRASMERTVALVAGAAGGALALAAAPWALPSAAWGATWALLAVAAGALLLLVTRLRSVPGGDAWSIVAAVVAGTAATLAPAVGAAIELDAAEAVWIAPALATIVVCVAAALTRSRTSVRRHTMPAFIAAAVVALGAAVPALMVPLVLLPDVPNAAIPWWDADATAPRALGDTFGIDDLRLGAVLGALALAAGAVVVSGLLRRLRELAALPAAFAMTAALAAGLGAPTLLAAVAVLLGTAVAALVVAALPAVRSLAGVTIVLATFGITSAAVAWALAHGSVDLWWWVVPVLIGTAIGGRVLTARLWSASTAATAGPLHSAAATAMVLVGAFALPGWSAAAGATLADPWSWSVFVLGFAAAILVAVPASPSVPNRMPRADRLAIAIPSFAAAVGAVGLITNFAITPFGWLPAVVLVGAAWLWLRSDLLSIRYVAAAAIPVSLAFAAAGLLDEFGRAGSVYYGVAGAALSASVLAFIAMPRGAPTRWAWSGAVGAVALVALAGIATPGGTGAEPWLVLLILAPIPILVAALDGDPIGGDSELRHLSWLSLALAVGSVWTWFGSEKVVDVEAYTMPLAIALAVAGGLITWRRTSSDATLAGRTAVFASAAAVAVLPSVATSGDSEIRTLVLVASGTIVLIASLFLPERVRGVPVRVLAAATGWVAVTGAALVRGTSVAFGERSVLLPEFWPLIALAVGVFAALAWVRTRSRPTAAAEWVLAGTLVATAIPTLAAVLEEREPVARTVVLLSVLAVVHVANAGVRTRPFAGPVLRWTSLGALVIAGVLVLAGRFVEPFDVVTVPVAVGLIGAGAVRMARDRSVGSWPALGPGLATLLVPALIADWTEPELWRLVALGVVSAGTVVIGAVRRLQAPVVLGGAVLLVHGVAQLWPWISWLYEAVWWWLWLGVAGALLIAIAATYERQLRLARGAVRTIADLR